MATPRPSKPTVHERIVDNSHWLLVAILAVVLAGAGIGLATLLTDDDGQPEALCLTLTSPPAASSACVNGQGETISSSTSTGTTTTTTTPTTPTVPTTPTGTPTPSNDDFELSACTPSTEAGHLVVCKTNSPQAFRFECGKTYDLVQLIVEENAVGASKDAAFMNGACPDPKQTIVRRLEIRNEQCDGLKQSGQNLIIEGGFVDLPRLRPPYEPGGLDCHVDAFQLGCSKHVHVKNMAIRGWGHSGFFVNCFHGSEQLGGFDVTLEDSYVMRSPEGPQPFDTDATIGDSDSSGVLRSTLCKALQWEVYIPKTPSTGGDQARNPIVEDNTIEDIIPVDGCAQTE